MGSKELFFFQSMVSLTPFFFDPKNGGDGGRKYKDLLCHSSEQVESVKVYTEIGENPLVNSTVKTSSSIHI